MLSAQSGAVQKSRCNGAFSFAWTAIQQAHGTGRKGRAKRKRTPQREVRDLGAAARPGISCKRCPQETLAARQKKKLILERGCVLGFLEGEVQIDIVVSKNARRAARQLRAQRRGSQLEKRSKADFAPT